MSDILPAMRRHWIEYVATFVALAVSVISLWVAIGTEDANRRMVAAASWPLLQAEDTNSGNSNEPDIRLSVINSGVGPAKLETMEISWKGHPYRSGGELLADCCGFKAHRFPAPPGEPPHTPVTTGTISGLVVRAGETRTFLDLPRGSDNAEVWDKFDAVRRQLVYRACYCSVFDECWISTLRNLDARRVDRCPVVKDLYVE